MKNLHRPLFDHSPDWTEDIFAGLSHSTADHDPVRIQKPDDIAECDPDSESDLLPDALRDRVARSGRFCSARGEHSSSVFVRPALR